MGINHSLGPRFRVMRFNVVRDVGVWLWFSPRETRGILKVYLASNSETTSPSYDRDSRGEREDRHVLRYYYLKQTPASSSRILAKNRVPAGWLQGFRAFRARCGLGVRMLACAARMRAPPVPRVELPAKLPATRSSRPSSRRRRSRGPDRIGPQLQQQKQQLQRRVGRGRQLQREEEAGITVNHLDRLGERLDQKLNDRHHEGLVEPGSSPGLTVRNGHVQGQKAAIVPLAERVGPRFD
jgi:hypothetical protein